MQQEQFKRIEAYMLRCMRDSAHDKEHVYRVLYTALELARYEKGVDDTVLLAACLLHDIGREAQFRDQSLCHAAVGGRMAEQWLIQNGFPNKLAARVHRCVAQHRFRSDNPPDTLEAKLLFDADKLDSCGAIGLARTLIYKGQVTEPLYSLNADGSVSDGAGDAGPSFFQEYKLKLERLSGKFYTERGKKLALQREAIAKAFYSSMLAEVRDCYENGRERLAGALANPYGESHRK